MDTTLLSIYCYTILRTITHNEIAICHSNIFNYTWLLLKCNSATPSSPVYFILLLLHYFYSIFAPPSLTASLLGTHLMQSPWGCPWRLLLSSLWSWASFLAIVSYHQRQLSFDFLLILHLYISISFLHTPFQRLFTVSAQSPQK